MTAEKYNERGCCLSQPGWPDLWAFLPDYALPRAKTTSGNGCISVQQLKTIRSKRCSLHYSCFRVWSSGAGLNNKSLVTPPAVQKEEQIPPRSATRAERRQKGRVDIEF